MTSKWTQSNKLVNLRHETSCTNITRGFPFWEGCKKKSSFVWTGVDNFCAVIALKKSASEHVVLFTQIEQYFSKRSSTFPTSVLVSIDDCSTWLICFCNARFTKKVSTLLCALNETHVWHVLLKTVRSPYKNDKCKVTQDFGAHSVHGARRTPWNFNQQTWITKRNEVEDLSRVVMGQQNWQLLNLILFGD